LNEQEFNVVQLLRHKQEVSLTDVQELLQRRNVYPVLRTLFNEGIALSREELFNKYKPKTETFISLDKRYDDEVLLEQLFEQLQRAPKQVEVILAYTQLHHKTKFVRKNELIQTAKCDASVIKKLVEKNILTEFKVEVSRLGFLKSEDIVMPELNELQRSAFNEIKRHHETSQTVLLNGVTGSGKTMLYIEMIKQHIEAGHQVLYMLPEIALTAQLIGRLRKVFNNRVGIYHSKFNLNERVEIWHKVLHGEYSIVLGARSSLLLPFKDLKLIIVDEEHDSSYKQTDPAPRYQARDSANALAQMCGAKVILGSATPSVESFYNASSKGKFGMVKLDARYGNAVMPLIEFVNLKEAKKRHQVKGNFSVHLIEAIQKTLDEKSQVILFLNRRGYAEYQECTTCDYVYKCKNCDVSLTFHKFQQRLVCHYCGYNEKPDTKCRACGSNTLEIAGSGTEQIEEEIATHLPGVRIGRLDLDTLKTKNGHAQMIAAFENRELDILVGTQMVTKGLDFDNVSLVGIINADRMIYHSGYKSAERAYQLMTQVAGRAGRKDKAGRVIIQTSNPEHVVIKQVMEHDYKSMYETALIERQQFLYPPFTRLIQLTLRCKDVKILEQAALWLANNVKALKRSELLGPAVPYISRINSWYLREILLKTNNSTGNLQQFKNLLSQKINELKSIKELKGVDVKIDVDAGN
jgi:primosomal protein N' (replication factor Y)